MSKLSLLLNRYKSKKDIQIIYDNLSDKHKDTHWAKNIKRFLFSKFQNTSLFTLNKNTRENIVQDTSKYNLVIFTASWCKPCIEEIPLLKEIYSDLKENLIMTLVSIDENETIENFQKLVQEEKITIRYITKKSPMQTRRDKSRKNHSNTAL